jgi:hypothetical protein
MGVCGLDPSGSRQGLAVGPWEEHGDEPSRELHQKLNDYWFLEKDSAPHSSVC